MPEGYHKLRPYPGKAYTLRKAAADNLIIQVRCRSCKGPLIRFLAADLAILLGGDREAYLPPYPCSKCGTDQYVKVTFHQPSAGDYGHLVVRRPAGVRETQMWRSVKLGD